MPLALAGAQPLNLMWQMHAFLTCLAAHVSMAYDFLCCRMTCLIYMKDDETFPPRQAQQTTARSCQPSIGASLCGAVAYRY